jgi:hypothetical protein
MAFDFNQDPWWLEAVSEAARLRALYDAQEAEARRQAIIALGGGSDADYAGWGLSAEDIAAGKANYASGHSVLARLAKAHEDRQRGLINNLAGRGIIYSGETGYQTTQEGRAYGNEQFDARAKVLDYLRGIQGQRLEREESIRSMLNQARYGAYERALNAPLGAGPIDPATLVTYDPRNRNQQAIGAVNFGTLRAPRAAIGRARIPQRKSLSRFLNV